VEKGWEGGRRKKGDGEREEGMRGIRMAD